MGYDFPAGLLPADRCMSYSNWTKLLQYEVPGYKSVLRHVIGRVRGFGTTPAVPAHTSQAGPYFQTAS
jgi:hypothetical protein